ncbi:SulP family transporter [Lonsdalea britannica]|uniref:SulP family inorganic anion transporter n=1 Tax=Lonsdalea britannica TaxID=1082704 RepID=A0AAD0SFA6_9GAMM|nr:SulP family inorganic anion transporter [Lonsdalea britannica]AXW86804.1 SulP family inorganic anion transporter [Lonsdalea britannica]OSM95116.1 SulP family transporter [Lonsdalea britannica]OSN04438.1 SulP family transporter [Lonsdalea britannica]
MNLSTLRQDIPAGIVVFLVALPLCLGIAQASGLPPFVGLVTGVIGGLVVTLLSPSRYAVSGPAAGLVTIVSGAIESLGSFAALLFAIMLSGVLQYLMGMARIGRFISVVPSSVIRGMLAAIGLLLIMQQIPLALGFPDAEQMSSLWRDPSLLPSFSAPFVALSGLLLLWCWDHPAIKQHKILSWFPGPLVAVLFGGLCALFGDRVVADFATTLPRIQLPSFENLGQLAAEAIRPDWQVWNNPTVYVVAVTLALVASLETLLSQEALKKIKPQTPPPSPDKELRAQGVGNLLSGFVGGLPITAVIVRSSVNVNAGARSKIAILLHAVLLLLSVRYMSQLLNIIPLASLAAVLLYTGYKLAAPALFVSQWKNGWQQFAPFIITIAGIIVFGMLAGIGLGIAAQLAISSYKSHRNALQLTRYGNHFVLRFQKNLTFVHNPHLQSLLNKIPSHSVVIVEHDNADYIDADVKNMLLEFREEATQRGIRLAQWPL